MKNPRGREREKKEEDKRLHISRGESLISLVLKSFIHRKASSEAVALFSIYERFFFLASFIGD